MLHIPLRVRSCGCDLPLLRSQPLHQFSPPRHARRNHGSFASALSTSITSTRSPSSRWCLPFCFFSTAMCRSASLCWPGDRQHLPGPHSHGPTSGLPIAASWFVLWLLVFYPALRVAGILSGVCGRAWIASPVLLHQSIVIDSVSVPWAASHTTEGPPSAEWFDLRLRDASDNVLLLLSTRPCSPLAAMPNRSTSWPR